ncbi:hypothetical protein [Nocardia inohanensis]|uniref:hypothetical protein n=1 Tax=Nocardia inohanensis TaxID=209246 RepID=UPI000A44F897|nr:hypothetical protein [Nocardia inohanensis]
MMRALLIGFGLLVVGASIPGLAAITFPIVLLIGIAWVVLWHLKSSYIRRWWGGRR